MHQCGVWPVADEAMAMHGSGQLSLRFHESYILMGRFKIRSAQCLWLWLVDVCVVESTCESADLSQSGFLLLLQMVSPR